MYWNGGSYACTRRGKPLGGSTSALVGTGRFELPTCRLGGDRSIHLSYVPARVQHDCILPALQALAADIRAVVHAVEMNLAGSLVCIPDSRGEIFSTCRDAQNAAAGGL